MAAAADVAVAAVLALAAAVLALAAAALAAAAAALAAAAISWSIVSGQREEIGGLALDPDVNGDNGDAVGATSDDDDAVDSVVGS